MLHYEPNQRVQSKNNGKPRKCVLKPMRTLNGLEFIKGFLRGPILLTPSSLPSFLLALRLEIVQTNRVQNSTRSLVQHSSHFTLSTCSTLRTFRTRFILLTLYCPQSLFLTLYTCNSLYCLTFNAATINTFHTLYLHHSQITRCTVVINSL